MANAMTGGSEVEPRSTGPARPPSVATLVQGETPVRPAVMTDDSRKPLFFIDMKEPLGLRVRFVLEFGVYGFLAGNLALREILLFRRGMRSRCLARR